ncbi:MBL fold metallo-hydrolase [bacterium]|nr:MBL fold metallo-hydrolase [bacterium]
MIFRQFFDEKTWTYSYLIADPGKQEAAIIDPVLDHTDHYLTVISNLDLKLVYSMDTHVHADHITGTGKLGQLTDCTSVIGAQAKVECVDRKITEGETIKVGGLVLNVLYTPGHTDDSYSFLMKDRIFTGDTLLIRSTGRTDFQNGNADQQYDSIFNKLLKLPDELLLYPAHDYKGWTVSTIGEERRFNPRLQVPSRQAYVDQMNALKLDNPRFMDIAVPANLKCGLID